MFIANCHVNSWLPKQLEGKTLLIKGRIISLPNQTKRRVKFLFQTNLLDNVRKKYQLKLNWYYPMKYLLPGDDWQFMVRLKRPHGFANPGGFDYEAWLFQHNISAIGYVVNSSENHILNSSSYNQPILRLRYWILKRIKLLTNGKSLAEFLPAFIIGARSEVISKEWSILQQTGTNHLIAIAGLHIGIIAGFFFFVINFIWRWLPILPLYIPSQCVAATASLISAVFYSMLAGFSLPTQRALIMLTVILIATLLRRRVKAGNSMALALMIVLFLQPLSVLGSGFWLSFVAVGMITYSMCGRLRSGKWWWKFLKIQLIIAIGITPVTLYFFQQTSLISPLANILAVPWFGILILPTSFLASVFMFINQTIAKFLLLFALQNLHGLFWLLCKLASLPISNWHFGMMTGFTVFCTMIAVILLLAPKGLPCRYLSGCFLLPIFFPHISQPKVGNIWLTVLDVGQGLAAVVRTSNHTLVYDTGPKFSPEFNAGSAVLIPYLYHIGIRNIDMLVISHGDNDHIGGAKSLLKNISVARLLSSVPRKFTNFPAEYCHRGQHWIWDGISFNILSPPIGDYNEGNNSSCVLRINNGKQSIILTGDIEKDKEEYLLRHKLLPAKILVAPHHGSRTSSTWKFLEAIKPSYVIYSVGYRNRFHFPSVVVQRRYHRIGAKAFSTVPDGAITFKISDDKIKISKYRKENRNVWSL